MTIPPPWLQVTRGSAPLIVSLPHAGTLLPAPLRPPPVSSWLATLDTDWYVAQLYDFAAALGATVVRTALSRTVIDVNRDPWGASLYPGQPTTDLCPRTTFDGVPLYAPGAALDDAQVAARRAQYHDPYHAALAAEIDRLRERHPTVVLYDAHAIRSRVPRLFDGVLPHFNIGTHSGRSCAAPLVAAVESVCRRAPYQSVVDGRFKGGYITRHHGRPADGVHAIQMELACRAYLHEPDPPLTDANWPPEYDPGHAAPLRERLRAVLQACLDFAHSADLVSAGNPR